MEFLANDAIYPQGILDVTGVQLTRDLSRSNGVIQGSHGGQNCEFDVFAYLTSRCQIVSRNKLFGSKK